MLKIIFLFLFFFEIVNGQVFWSFDDLSIIEIKGNQVFYQKIDEDKIELKLKNKPRFSFLEISNFSEEKYYFLENNKYKIQKFHILDPPTCQGIYVILEINGKRIDFLRTNKEDVNNVFIDEFSGIYYDFKLDKIVTINLLENKLILQNGNVIPIKINKGIISLNSNDYILKHKVESKNLIFNNNEIYKVSGYMSIKKFIQNNYYSNKNGKISIYFDNEILNINYFDSTGKKTRLKILEQNWTDLTFKVNYNSQNQLLKVTYKFVEFNGIKFEPIYGLFPYYDCFKVTKSDLSEQISGYYSNTKNEIVELNLSRGYLYFKKDSIKADLINDWDKGYYTLKIGNNINESFFNSFQENKTNYFFHSKSKKQNNFKTYIQNFEGKYKYNPIHQEIPKKVIYILTDNNSNTYFSCNDFELQNKFIKYLNITLNLKFSSQEILNFSKLNAIGVSISEIKKYSQLSDIQKFNFKHKGISFDSLSKNINEWINILAKIDTNVNFIISNKTKENKISEIIIKSIKNNKFQYYNSNNIQFPKPLNNVEEKLFIQIIENEPFIEIYYQAQNSQEISLQIVKVDSLNKKYYISFPNQNQVLYELFFNFNERKIICKNPDGTIQEFYLNGNYFIN